MGLFDFFKKSTKSNEGIVAADLFKEDKDADVVRRQCNKCEVQEFCSVKSDGPGYLCGFALLLDDYDKNKPSIILFDDNMGVISFLEDNLKEISEEEDDININDFNVLKFSSQYAGFQLESTLRAYNGLNVKYAIFDITLGGGVYDEEKGNVILDGVDAFISVSKYHPDVKYIFFTGNKLNPYINKNKAIMKKFEDFTGESIQEHILYKTGLAPDDRKKYLANFIRS